MHGYKTECHTYLYLRTMRQWWIDTFTDCKNYGLAFAGLNYHGNSNSSKQSGFWSSWLHHDSGAGSGKTPSILRGHLGCRPWRIACGMPLQINRNWCLSTWMQKLKNCVGVRLRMIQHWAPATPSPITSWEFQMYRNMKDPHLIPRFLIRLSTLYFYSHSTKMFL